MLQSNVNPRIDPNVLKIVSPCLWKPAPLTDLVLALEVTDGPYKGVVFAYTHFELVGGPVKEGEMVPVKFDTQVYVKPKGFEQDEAFDTFTSEILLAWLTHLSAEGDSYKELATTKTTGVH